MNPRIPTPALHLPTDLGKKNRIFAAKQRSLKKQPPQNQPLATQIHCATQKHKNFTPFEALVSKRCTQGKTAPAAISSNQGKKIVHRQPSHADQRAMCPEQAQNAEGQ
jgi:hypothetical protein